MVIYKIRSRYYITGQEQIKFLAALMALAELYLREPDILACTVY